MASVNNLNPQCITYSQMQMIFDMRNYYRRIAILTRSYLRNRYYNLGQPDQLFDRLYLEYIDLGSMLHLNFGRESEDRDSQLLGQFVIDLRDLISAQIAGNTEAINQNLQQIYSNINANADYLASINPYWSADEYKNLFGTYFQYLIKDANALASGNFKEDAALYDSMTDLADRSGDTFAQGVYNYINSGQTIPAKPGEPCITYEQMKTIQDITTFWFDLEVWMRSYMLSKYLNVGDLEADYNRIKQVIVDYTNAIKNVYGEEFSAKLSKLLNEYLDLFVKYTNAQKSGNTDEMNRIIPLMYQNTASRAALQASANPFLSEDEWRKRLNEMEVQGVINESAAISSGDITRSLDIYIDLLTKAESMAGYFGRALFNYYAQPQANQ